MEPRTFTITSETDGSVLIHEGEHEILGEDTPRSWGSEKTAIQWLRRLAQREAINIVIVKLDMSHMYLDYFVPAPPPVVICGKHVWHKANNLPLADRGGPYDKLVCNFCGKIARRYKKLRHFKEENEICEKNVIGCEGQ